MKVQTRVGNFPRKNRTLDHVYTGTEPTVNTEIQDTNITETKNTLLKGIHLLDTIKEFTKDQYIPVPENEPDVRRSVSILDSNSPNGDKIYFSFYKKLVDAVYAEIQELTATMSKDGQLATITDKDTVTRIANQRGVDQWLLRLIMSGSSSLLVYLLHKAMTPFIAQDIANSVQPQVINPTGMVVLQATGMLASRGLEELNQALAKYGKSTIKTTTTTETTTAQDADPIEQCWHSLYQETDKIVIMDYVEEYLKDNYSSEYAPWLLYEDVYARVMVLYNRLKLLKPNTTTISEINTVVEKHFDDDTMKEFIDDISNIDYNYSLDISPEDAQLFRKSFDEIAAALTDYHYIQNAICCMFKYLLNLDIKDVKRFRDFIALYRSSFKASSDFSNLRALEAFSEGIKKEISEIISTMRYNIKESILDINGNINETVACFSVNDFINIMLDFVDTLEADLVAFADIVFNIYSGWQLDLDQRLDFITDFKELDYFIGILDYVINAMATCEVENRDDPRAPYEINNYVSNYINPTLKKFPRASFSDIIEPTEENSYPPGTTLVLNNKVYTIDREKLGTVDMQTYISCQDKSSTYDSTYDI